jgi:ketosteroid isomerase-like protein
MHTFITLAVIGLGLLATVGNATAGESGDADAHRQALAAARAAWNQAIEQGDMPRIFSYWTDDVVIYPVGEAPVRGIAAVRDYVAHNRRDLGLAPRTKPLEIVASASGDLGYIVGTYEWVDREGKSSRPGRYVTLWRPDDKGQWKCYLEIHSPRPDDGSEGP